MSMAWDRPHLASCGYEYENGSWYCTFEDKEVVARKDHPKFGIKKGEKHRFIKTKVICDETGRSSWGVIRKPLVVPLVVPPAPVSWGASWGSKSTESTSWTGSWTRKD